MLNLAESFNAVVEEYKHFERIASPASHRPDLCAYLLLDKLVPGTRRMVSAAEHDEIWLETDCNRLSEVACEADIQFLARCGVRYSVEYGCLSLFV